MGRTPGRRIGGGNEDISPLFAATHSLVTRRLPINYAATGSGGAIRENRKGIEVWERAFRLDCSHL
jgi:hypothetical protein